MGTSLPGLDGDETLVGMTIGASLFLIAAGAILAFAVTAEFVGIDIQIVGYILLAIGVFGLVLGLVFLRRARPPAA